MKISKYTLFVDDYPNPGEHLVYHSRTQALVKIDDDLRRALVGLEEGAVQTRLEEIRALHRMGIVVRDEAEDRERLDRFMEQKKYGVNESRFIATILTTYNCNFACTYCFEESTRTSSQKLDRSTSERILEWLKRKVKKLGAKRVVINYYGGEPLLNEPMIDYITTRMKDWSDSEGIQFQFRIQTNGLLLTPAFVDKYLPLGFKEAQVSLDGVREVHDRQRPMRGSGRGTFDAVIENLQAVADKVQIIIATGYDKGDPQPVIDLLEYLDSIGLLKKLKKFTYSPIHPTLGPKGHTHEIVSPGCMSNYDTDTLITAERKIKEAMRQKGLWTGSGLSAAMCPVTSGDSGVTIDTQGLIFKCNAMLGHPELAVGSIQEEEYNARRKEFLDADAWKKCDADCPYVPLCNTGCRLFSFFKYQDFSAKSCERSYMDKFVSHAIKEEYHNQMRKKQEVAS